jgi:hypothetical protein
MKHSGKNNKNEYSGSHSRLEQLNMESRMKLSEDEEEMVTGGFLDLRDILNDIASRGEKAVNALKYRFNPFGRRDQDRKH